MPDLEQNRNDVSAAAKQLALPLSPQPHSTWASIDIHLKVREQLDPTSRFLSDDDIQTIIRMHYGNEESIVRQCLLGLSVHAEDIGQMSEAVRFRRLLFSFETGTYSLAGMSEVEQPGAEVGEAEE